VDLEKLVDWLGYLFDWADIKATHAVLANLAVQALDYTSSALTGAETAVNNFFDTLEAKFKSVSSVPAAAASANMASLSAQTASGGTGPLGTFKSSPVANFSNYQVMHGGVLNTNPALPPVSSDVANLFVDFFTQVVEPTAGAIGNTVSTLFQDLKAAFEGGTLTPAQVLEKMGDDAILGVLEVGRALAVGALDILGDLLQLLQAALTAELDIPLLSALYQQIVGEPMSIIDGLALLMAIPVTVITKMATGQAPFAGSPVDMSSATYEQLAADFGCPVSAPSAQATTSAPGAIPVVAALGNTTGDSGPSPAELVYSHAGGYVYSASWTISAAISLFAGLSGTEALWPGRVAVGFNVLAVSASLPVGDDTDKAGLTFERLEWVNTISETIRDGLFLFAGPEMEVGTGLLQLSQAVIGEILFLVVMIEELVGSYSAAQSIIKFIQNTINSIGDGLSGGAKLIPSTDPDPDQQALRKGLEIGSSALSFIAAGINVARTAGTDAGDIHYVL
jgi:hypothetical protein